MLGVFASLVFFVFILVFLGYLAIAAFYILKFTLPPVLRLLIFLLFGLSRIKAGDLKSFDGTYMVTYLKWNDKYGRVYSTDEKRVKVKKMYYGFAGDDFYSDFHVSVDGVEMFSESGIGSINKDSNCQCEIIGWFTLSCFGSAEYPNSRTLSYEIKMIKFSNRVVSRCFRCLSGGGLK